MSFLPIIIQKTIDQELIKQANSIKDIIYDEFQKIFINKFKLKMIYLLQVEIKNPSFK